jgi:hypothetical protein
MKISNRRHAMLYNTLKYNERYNAGGILNSEWFGFRYTGVTLDGVFIYDPETPTEGNWEIRSFCLENYNFMSIYKPETPINTPDVNEVKLANKTYALLYNLNKSAVAYTAGTLIDAQSLNMKYASFYTDLDVTTNAKGQYDENLSVGGKWEVRGYLPATENVISLFLKVSD